MSSGGNEASSKANSERRVARGAETVRGLADRVEESDRVGEMDAGGSQRKK